MKNKFGLIILILLALSLMLTLSSCDIFNAFSGIEQCVHIDTDDDFKCDRCEESFNDGKNVIPDDGKDDGKGDEASNCSHEDLDDNEFCDKCGVSYYDGIHVTPHTHTCERITVFPTCTEEGYDKRYCTECDFFEKDTFKEKFGHTVFDKYYYSSTEHWNRCYVCGEVTDLGAHTLDERGYCTVCENPIFGTDGIVYELSEDGTYAIVTAYTGEATDIIIAPDYEGKPVTHIADNVFDGMGTITSVFIPNGVTHIGMGAFYNCVSLEKITFPETLLNVERAAFYGCKKLPTTYLDAMTYIGNGDNPYFLLYDVPYMYEKSYPIHEDTKVIAGAAFENTQSATELIIPDGVRAISNFACVGCSFETVTIPKSVIYFGVGAFNGCTNVKTFSLDEKNPVYTMEKGTIYTRDFTTLVRHTPKHFTTSLIMPDTVTKIERNAVSDCLNLRYIKLSSGLTEIAMCAFSGCLYLDEIEIPDNITRISELAFYRCENLSGIVIGSGVTEIADSAFSETDLFLIYYKGDYDAWNSITVDFKKNKPLEDAMRFYYSDTPSTDKNERLWHYNEYGKPASW